MKKLLLISAMGLAVQGCAASPDPTSSVNKSKSYSNRFSTEEIKKRREEKYKKQQLELEKKNPTSEAQNAINSQSYYLLAYQSAKGIPPKIPGVSQPQSLNTHCRVLQLEGMGDSIYGPNHLKYRAALQKYAMQFNLQMLPHCQ